MAPPAKKSRKFNSGSPTRLKRNWPTRSSNHISRTPLRSTPTQSPHCDMNSGREITSRASAQDNKSTMQRFRTSAADERFQGEFGSSTSNHISRTPLRSTPTQSPHCDMNSGRETTSRASAQDNKSTMQRFRTSAADERFQGEFGSSTSNHISRTPLRSTPTQSPHCDMNSGRETTSRASAQDNKSTMQRFRTSAADERLQGEFGEEPEFSVETESASSVDVLDMIKFGTAFATGTEECKSYLSKRLRQKIKQNGVFNTRTADNLLKGNADSALKTAAAVSVAVTHYLNVVLEKVNRKEDRDLNRKEEKEDCLVRTIPPKFRSENLIIGVGEKRIHVGKVLGDIPTVQRNLDLVVRSLGRVFLDSLLSASQMAKFTTSLAPKGSQRTFPPSIITAVAELISRGIEPVEVAFTNKDREQFDLVIADLLQRQLNQIFCHKRQIKKKGKPEPSGKGFEEIVIPRIVEAHSTHHHDEFDSE